MHLKYSLIALAFVMLFSSLGFAWLDGFTYRTEITVDSTANFSNKIPQVPIILNDSNVNYSHIASGEYALTYWNGSVEVQKVVCEMNSTNHYGYNESGNSYIWYNGTNGTYYVYYTNTSAVGNYFDCGEVFGNYIYDDFSSSLNTTLWSDTSGGETITTDGYLKVLESADIVKGAVSNKAFSFPSVLFFNYNTTSAARYTYLGYSSAFDGYTTPVALLVRNTDTSLRYGITSTPTTTATSTWDAGAAFHDYQIAINTTELGLFQNRVKDGLNPTSKVPNATAINITLLSNLGSVAYVDYIFLTDNIAGMAYSYGEEVINADILSISAPVDDSVNYGRNTTFTFIPELVSDTTANFSLYINGTYNNTFNATSGIPYTTYLTLNHGEYILYINKTDNATVNASVAFYVKEYAINSTSGITNPLITQPISFYVYVSNYTNRATSTVYVSLNGTTYAASLDSSDGFNQSYKADIVMPEIAGTYNITTVLVLNFGTYSYNETNLTEFTASAFTITNCSTGVESIVFNIKDELNESYLTNATFKTIVSYYIGASYFNYSYTFTNQDNATLCITPNYTTIYANVGIIISKEGFSQRTNYLVNASLTNSTQNITTYLITNTSTNLIDFEVNDEYNLDLVGAYIKVQRYYTSSTSWVDITTLKTDGLGQASAWLVPYTEAYRFLVYEGNVLVKTIDPMYLTADSYIFDLLGSAGNDYAVFNGVVIDCEYNNETKIMRCTATDPSGLMTSATLVVYENKMFGADIYCTSTAVGSAITPTCNLNDVSGFSDNATYIFSGVINGNTYIFETGLIGSIPTISDYGLTGVYATLLLFITLVLLGAWNPSAAVVLGGVAIFVSKMLGILIISEVVLVIILFITLITVYKLRT